MTPLRQRMTNDMTVRGLAENTKRSYLNSVTGARTFDQSRQFPTDRPGRKRGLRFHGSVSAL